MNTLSINNINSQAQAFYSIKNEKLFKTNSSLENDFFYIFEADKNITSYDVRPFEVNITAITGELYQYTPACVIEKNDSCDIWVEFVNSETFLNSSTHYEKLFAEIKQAAAILKVEFVVLSEADINNQELQISKMEYILNKKALLTRQLGSNLIAA